MSKQKRNTNLGQLPLFDPLMIECTKGYKALVDPIDADLVEYNWSASGDEKKNNVYAVRHNRHNKAIRMHVVVMERVLGRSMMSKEEVDHINGDHFDNRRENLRPSTRTENMRNQALRKNSRSGLKGASHHKSTGKWQSQIEVNTKKVYLGLYDTAEEAHQAYLNAAEKYFGEFMREK